MARQLGAHVRDLSRDTRDLQRLAHYPAERRTQDSLSLGGIAATRGAQRRHVVAVRQRVAFYVGRGRHAHACGPLADGRSPDHLRCGEAGDLLDQPRGHCHRRRRDRSAGRNRLLRAELVKEVLQASSSFFRRAMNSFSCSSTPGSMPGSGYSASSCFQRSAATLSAVRAPMRFQRS